MTTVAKHVGAVCSPAGACPSSVTQWLATNTATFSGLLGSDKVFYGDTMSTFQVGHKPDDNESQLPPATLIVVTFGEVPDAELTGYVQSIPHDRNVLLAYHQEAENNFPNGDYTLFKANFEHYATLIHGVGNPAVRVLQNSAGSPYGHAGSTAAQGLWIVDRSFVDIYSIDTYQNQDAGQLPPGGLASYAEFQTWLGLVIKQNRWLGITEYGVDACSGNAARNARIQLDNEYLRDTFPLNGQELVLWEYWYSDCQAGILQTDCNHQHQFTDEATIDTWNAILAGTI